MGELSTWRTHNSRTHQGRRRWPDECYGIRSEGFGPLYLFTHNRTLGTVPCNPPRRAVVEHRTGGDFLAGASSNA